MVQHFTITPKPPCAGQDAKICYNGPLPTSVTVTFTPPGTSQTYQLTAAKPCVTVAVPANAGSVNAVDNSGASDDLNSPVVDCGGDAAAPAKKRKPKRPKKK